ncbi:MAG: replication endonuclease [Methylobacter sp.]|uniref:replication endonuclease n=1 Tax=Methylobacter sp. TaxID=2051955 RepID=UPI00258E6262|nr:replication endonuclease [Methylobacter sp.]MCL7421795.1 replication endonuclease [Methylobacter sp.]
MNYIEKIQYGNYNNTDNILQILENKLLQLLECVDSSTREELLTRTSKIKFQNKGRYLVDLIEKVEKAMNATDVRMINVKYFSIKNAATAIVNNINGYINNGYASDAEHLIKLFYAIDNSDIQAPRIILTANKSQQKSLENVKSEKWWTNKLRKVISQNREHLKLLIGLVNKEMPYSSDLSLIEKRKADKNRQRYLELNGFASNHAGQFTPVSKSEERKFSEIYCVLKGIDKYAKINKLSSALITITPPSNFHISSSNYNKETPKDISRSMAKKWSKFTQTISKKHEFYFAFRVVEFHIDGTPHFHVLFYFKTELKQDYQLVLKKVFNTDTLSGSLIDWKDIDRSRGTCIGYVVKTLKPSSQDETDDVNNNERVVSGRRLWRLRSHDYAGMPKKCIVCWRELRKLVNTDITDPKVFDMLKHVKENDFYYFFKAYKNGDISLSVAEDKKIIGINIYGVHIINKKYNKQIDNQRIIKSKIKINVNNYPSKNISFYPDFIQLTSTHCAVNEPFFEIADKFTSLAKTVISYIKAGLNSICVFNKYFGWLK